MTVLEMLTQLIILQVVAILMFHTVHQLESKQQMSISVWERQDTAGRTDHPNDCYMISLSRWNGWKFQTQPTLPFLTVYTDSADI